MPNGVHVVVDTVGSIKAIMDLFDVMVRGGHIVSAGFYGTDDQIALQPLRAREVSIDVVSGWTIPRMDETLALPTEKAVKIALRTQQLIAYETGVANVIDPLAGSYYVESLTDRMEREAEAYFEKIEKLGGVVAAIEKGFMQREIGDAAYKYQQQIEKKERIVVGVNKFIDEHETIDIDILKIDPRVEDDQAETLKMVRERRDGVAARNALEEIRAACRDEGINLMPKILHAAKVEATLGEMIQVMREEFGEYREPPIF